MEDAEDWISVLASNYLIHGVKQKVKEQQLNREINYTTQRTKSKIVEKMTKLDWERHYGRKE